MQALIDKLVGLCLLFCVLLLTVGSVFTFFDSNWLGYLLAQFKLQLMAGGLVLSVLFLLRKELKLCALALVVAVSNISWFTSILQNPTVQAVEKQGICITQINLHYQNSRLDLVTDYISKIAPDVVIFEEFTPEWQKLMNASRPLSPYKYRVAAPQTDTFGIAVFSRLPMLDSSVTQLAFPGFPCISSILDTPIGKVRLIGVHLFPPANPRQNSIEMEQLQKLIPIVSSAKLPTILAGDCNSTPWTTPVRRFLSATGLVETRTLESFAPTWPTTTPLVSLTEHNSILVPLGLLRWLVAMPLDNFFVSRDLAASRRSVGPFIGSDHYPLCIRVSSLSEKLK